MIFIVQRLLNPPIAITGCVRTASGQELYDELNDPGEMRNLAAEPFYARTVAEMKQVLATARSPSR